MFKPLKLVAGASRDIEKGLCLMQMVSYFAGEEPGIYTDPCRGFKKYIYFSDGPQCASPVLSSWGRQLNDSIMDNERRKELWPFVFQLLGSRDDTVEHVRYKKYSIWMEYAVSGVIFDLRKWDQSLVMFQEAINLGKHGELDPVGQAPRYEELKKVLENA